MVALANGGRIAVVVRKKGMFVSLADLGVNQRDKLDA